MKAQNTRPHEPLYHTPLLPSAVERGASLLRARQPRTMAVGRKDGEHEGRGMRLGEDSMRRQDKKP